MPKPRTDKSVNLSPVANALIAKASAWRIEADAAEQKSERRTYSDALRECADDLEEFARS